VAGLVVALLNNVRTAGQPQSATPAPKISAIRVSGQKKFSAEQLISASGRARLYRVAVTEGPQYHM